MNKGLNLPAKNAHFRGSLQHNVGTTFVRGFQMILCLRVPPDEPRPGNPMQQVGQFTPKSVQRHETNTIKSLLSCVRTTQNLPPYLETTYYTKKVVKDDLNKRAGTNKVTVPVRNVNCWVPLQVPSEKVVSSFLACLDWPQIKPMPVQQQHDEDVKTIFLYTIHILTFCKFISKTLLCPSTL